MVIAGNRRFHAAIADVGRALGGAAGSRQAERGAAGSRQAERGVGQGGTARVIGGLAYDPPSAEALCGAWGGRLNRSLLLRTARDVAGRLAAPLPTAVATPAGRG